MQIPLTTAKKTETRRHGHLPQSKGLDGTEENYSSNSRCHVLTRPSNEYCIVNGILHDLYGVRCITCLEKCRMKNVSQA